jgi:transglutaminase-like putative cysteine protease
MESGGQESEDVVGSNTLQTGIESVSIVDSIEYEIVERLTVVNEGPGEPSKQNLWMALIRDVTPYQDVLSMEITPADYQISFDEYGNQYAEFDLSEMPAGTEIPIEVKYVVRVNELSYDLSKCKGDLPEEFIQPELHIESNNVQIKSLAEELGESRDTACEQVRAFYDHVGDNLVYSYNAGDWGAQAALGEMGADCTEYADLMIALSRASGIPARYTEGLYFGGEDVKPDARTEHAWLDVYLPGTGWTAMDPTLGRSSQNRDEYFAHYQPNHIIVTQGRNPSTLRGASYWTYIYWPGDSTKITIEDFEWEIERVGE